MKTKVFRVRPLKKTCSQCYNSFTGLYLQVFKTGLIFKINSSPACCQIQFVDACFHFEIPSSLVEKHDNFELDDTCGRKWFLQIGLLLQTCKIEACKTLIALVTRGTRDSGLLELK